ncbi:hypothetical protein MMYC01_201472 [Madurella mycetomatis]|uniref:MARVEL domain-containing protein n=1 Tax=Madurella mycetomatis TaxID=100816 RepID=A0A175WCV3_9PEZI|nr:hypothetical protein MMYC01_203920 [Madurella mycetomatis]KXX81343.1 hypothetical protein MMYC01_201472 [Madurella mycetomatis]
MMEPARHPPPHISSQGTYITKLILRALQFAIAIANIGLVGSLSIGILGMAALIAITPQSVASAIWSFSEILCIFARDGHRGIHPGACVAVDLLLWLALAPGTAILFLRGMLQDAQMRWLALVGLGFVLTVLHFGTFVIACVETSARNRVPQQVVLLDLRQHHLQPGMYGQPPLYHSPAPQPQQRWNYQQSAPMYAHPPQG